MLPFNPVSVPKLELPQKRLNSNQELRLLNGNTLVSRAFSPMVPIFGAGFGVCTMMTLKMGCAFAALAVAIPMTTVSANAAPLAAISAPSAVATGDNSLLTQVQWRGRRGGWGGRGAGLGIGLAAGALLGGAIAAGANPYYGPGYGYGYGYGGPVYAPAPVIVAPAYGGGDAEAYCMQRYRSYDPASGTYLNYDGNRYPCP